MKLAVLTKLSRFWDKLENGNVAIGERRKFCQRLVALSDTNVLDAYVLSALGATTTLRLCTLKLQLPKKNDIQVRCSILCDFVISSFSPPKQPKNSATAATKEMAVGFLVCVQLEIEMSMKIIPPFPVMCILLVCRCSVST